MGAVSRGMHERCPVCGSTNVVHITRVTGFFSIVENWNAGKKKELEDRRKHNLGD